MCTLPGLSCLALGSCWADKRASLHHIHRSHLALSDRYHLPLAELGGDFYDELKSLSSGYASFDYEESEYRWVHAAYVLCSGALHR